jgi:hypothetical protein
MQASNLAHSLVLYPTFIKLKEEGVSLAWEQYELALHCFLNGFMQTEKDFINLCVSLWAIRAEHEILVRTHAKAAWDTLDNVNLLTPETERSPSITSPKTTQAPQKNTGFVTEIMPHLDKTEKEDQIPEEESPKTESRNWREVELNFGKAAANKKGGAARQKEEEDTALETPFLFTDIKHFPFKERPTQQMWRRLRHRNQKVITSNIDLPATVGHYFKDGHIQLVYEQEYAKYNNFIFILDEGPGMRPFTSTGHYLVELLSGTAQTAETYYFTNYPVERDEGLRLFTSEQFNNSISLFQALQNLKNQDIIVIFSDAGAAKGEYDSDQVRVLTMLIEQLKKQTAKVIWMNPLPEDCWKRTTAEYLALLVNMFPANESGFQEAIRLLRKV